MKTIGLRALWWRLLPSWRSPPGSRQPATGRRSSAVHPTDADQGHNPGSEDPERGDVPGWVMITLMSAVLVAALLALAGPALEAMFNQAMDTVG